MSSGSSVGKLWRGDRWSLSEVSWREGVVTRIEALPGSGDEHPHLIPGFVDLHCHGGGGRDVMEGGDAVHTVARVHAKHGTAAFLATTMTAPVEEIEDALAAVAEAMKRQEPDEAKILGVHLEGPFISPDQLGAQPPFARPADLATMQRFCGIAPIRVVTLAPEADPQGRVAGWLRSQGVRVQIGHTLADFETSELCLRERADGVTHLFNAMGGFHHRKPGCIGAALAYATYAELICDLLHADRGAVLAALRAIPNLYAVTDATAASGMSDGTYKLGRQDVTRSGNSVRLPDGTLAGSCLTMDVAFTNILGLGLTLHEAVRRTSSIAAEYLGGGKSSLVEVGFAGRLLKVHGNTMSADSKEFIGDMKV